MFAFTRRRILSAGAALLAATTLANPAFAQDEAKDQVKAAFIYVGPVGDFGWTYAHDQGRKYLEEKLGDKVKTTYVENVAEGPDAERVLRQAQLFGEKLAGAAVGERFASGFEVL